MKSVIRGFEELTCVADREPRGSRRVKSPLSHHETSLSLQRTALVCPTPVWMEGPVGKPVTVLSVTVPPGGLDLPAPSVRPVETFSCLKFQWHFISWWFLFYARLRRGRVSGEPLQSWRNLSGPGQWLQVCLSSSVVRKDLPHWWVLLRFITRSGPKKRKVWEAV